MATTYPRRCVYLSGQYQLIENRPGGVYNTGIKCDPPRRTKAPTARVDLCPVEWGGDGRTMALSDPRCVKPRATTTSAARTPLATSFAPLATRSMASGSGSGFSMGSARGSSINGGGTFATTEAADMATDNGRITFNASLSGCGCGDATPSTIGPRAMISAINTSATSGATIPRWTWLVIVGAIVFAATKKDR
jgi:hypothetical protein